MTDELLLLDPSSPVPAYEQIKAQIGIAVASGRLAPGDALPSVRQLARDLSIAPNTVVRAYRELERDGWATAVPRRGVMIAGNVESLVAGERLRRLNQAVAATMQVAARLGIDAGELHAAIDSYRLHGTVQPVEVTESSGSS